MAGSVNKVILVGNLGKDPEVRKTQDGKSIVQLSVATSDSWRDKNTGERREKTEWHRVVIFNDGLARVAEVRQDQARHRLTVRGDGTHGPGGAEEPSGKADD